MKKQMKSFLLRMLMLAAILGAMCFTGAYAEGRLCAEMLLTPACVGLARAAWQAEKSLTGSRQTVRGVCVAPSDPDPLRAA